MGESPWCLSCQAGTVEDRGSSEGWNDLHSTPPLTLISLAFRLGIQQLRLIWGPHQILLTAQELTFLQQPPSRRVGEQVWAG
jgi:hypothetical protein